MISNVLLISARSRWRERSLPRGDTEVRGDTGGEVYYLGEILRSEEILEVYYLGEILR